MSVLWDYLQGLLFSFAVGAVLGVIAWIGNAREMRRERRDREEKEALGQKRAFEAIRDSHDRQWTKLLELEREFRLKFAEFELWKEGRGKAPDAAPPAKTEQALQALCRKFLPLFEIPEPKVSIQPPDVFRGGGTGRVVAHFVRAQYAIEINSEYLARATASDLADTMKHELIHAWIHQKGIYQSDCHDETFCQKARSVGVSLDFLKHLAA